MVTQGGPRVPKTCEKRKNGNARRSSRAQNRQKSRKWVTQGGPRVPKIGKKVENGNSRRSSRAQNWRKSKKW
jgi:hypothetical protein